MVWLDKVSNLDLVLELLLEIISSWMNVYWKFKLDVYTNPSLLKMVMLSSIVIPYGWTTFRLAGANHKDCQNVESQLRVITLTQGFGGPVGRPPTVLPYVRSTYATYAAISPQIS